MPAYNELIKEAEADYLKPLPPSVTDKKFTPPSGDNTFEE
jgi:hypothetical protein